MRKKYDEDLVNINSTDPQHKPETGTANQSRSHNRKDISGNRRRSNRENSHNKFQQESGYFGINISEICQALHSENNIRINKFAETIKRNKEAYQKYNKNDQVIVKYLKDEWLEADRNSQKDKLEKFKNNLFENLKSKNQNASLCNKIITIIDKYTDHKKASPDIIDFRNFIRDILNNINSEMDIKKDQSIKENQSNNLNAQETNEELLIKINQLNQSNEQLNQSNELQTTKIKDLYEIISQKDKDLNEIKESYLQIKAYSSKIEKENILKNQDIERKAYKKILKTLRPFLSDLMRQSDQIRDDLIDTIKHDLNLQPIGTRNHSVNWQSDPSAYDFEASNPNSDDEFYCIEEGWRLDSSVILPALVTKKIKTK